MASEGFGEGVERLQLAVTLNTGIDIPNLILTHKEQLGTLSGATVGALGSNVSASSVMSFNRSDFKQ